MTKPSSKSIAVNIQSEVQFFTVEPLLEELKRSFKEVKIVLDSFESNHDGYESLSSHVTELLKRQGLHPEFSHNLTYRVFDIYLTPYSDDPIRAKCYLKYEYGTLNAKPILTYIPTKMERFHGFLCQSTVTSSLLSCYGKTFPVDNLRFYGKKRRAPKTAQKRLLFAPTFNDQDKAEEFQKLIKILKSDYHIIVKSHHGIAYLKTNQQKKDVLESLADEYYGPETSLSELILDSDVCLFGNSSAIGEALYAGVPCAVFAHDLNYFKYGDLSTTQYQLVKAGYLPFADNISQVKAAVDKALSEKFIKKQRDLAKILFPQNYRTGTKGYLDAINYFLNSQEAKDYVIFHDEISKSRREMVAAKDAEIEHCAQILKGYEDGKLFSLARKLYQIEGKIRHVKS